MICCDLGSSGFSRNSFITILECSTHSFQASFETLSYTRFPISPFHGIRSRPGISRPNFTHFTMRTGCAVVPAPEFPALFSSAIQLSSRPCCISRYCNRHRNSSLQGSVSVSGTGVNQEFQSGTLVFTDPMLLAAVLAQPTADIGIALFLHGTIMLCFRLAVLIQAERSRKAVWVKYRQATRFLMAATLAAWWARTLVLAGPHKSGYDVCKEMDD